MCSALVPHAFSLPDQPLGLQNSPFPGICRDCEAASSLPHTASQGFWKAPAASTSPSLSFPWMLLEPPGGLSTLISVLGPWSCRHLSHTSFSNRGHRICTGDQWPAAEGPPPRTWGQSSISGNPQEASSPLPTAPAPLGHLGSSDPYAQAEVCFPSEL